jgi:2-polyprenyl-3-methyl-5-hydroxy-6-metoxy-1,4-benzoquinol methylase
MIFKGICICCPTCQGDLAASGEPHATLSCPYIDIEADRAKALRLADHYEALDFPGLVDYYYSVTPAVPPHHAKQYTRALMSGVSRAASALDAWEAHDEGGKPAETLLEVGCGTAPLLVAAARRTTARLVGVDIAFRWLAIAKKRLAEAGLDLPLFCACAEALPFPSGQFDRVVAESVLEHLSDQRQSVREIVRVMRPGGRLFLSTPNRLSIGPDPHLGIWGGGYLPQAVLDAYARRQGAVPPKRQLLSKAALATLLQAAGLQRIELFLSDVSADQRRQFPVWMRLAIDAYHAAKRLPGTRHALEVVGPIFYGVAERAALAESLRSSAPAEPVTRSRLSAAGT